MGVDVIGIAPDTDASGAFARFQPDIALVDINLRDGPTLTLAVTVSVSRANLSYQRTV